MVNQCKHCTSRGNLELCLKTPCSQHESWYAKKQAFKISNLSFELTELRTLAYLKDPTIPNKTIKGATSYTVTGRLKNKYFKE